MKITSIKANSVGLSNAKGGPVAGYGKSSGPTAKGASAPGPGYSPRPAARPTGESGAPKKK